MRGYGILDVKISVFEKCRCCATSVMPSIHSITVRVWQRV